MTALLPRLALSVVLASQAAAQTWTHLGPAPIGGSFDAGRVSAIVCHPTLPDRYFAAGADGGVWRTDTGGSTWTPLTDHLPASAVGALALDPADPDTIYAGTGEANFANHSRYGLGIYKSTDAGATWTHLAEPIFAGRCISRLVIDPRDPSRIFAAVTHAGGFPARAAAKGHPQADGPVGLFRSDDAGISWTHVSGGLPSLCLTDLVIDPADPSRMFAAAGRIFGDPANGIYRSTDSGATWVRLSAGLPAGTVGRIALAAAPSRAGRLYALITRPADASGNNASTLGGFRTDNAGDSWTSISPGSIQATYGWYLCVVGVSPTNPDTVLMGGLSLVRSTNAGSNFTTVTPPHVDLHAITWDAAGRLVVGDDGGVHRSPNNGTSWESRNNNLGTIQFYAGVSSHPTDPNRFLGGTQDNGSNLRTSDTLTWTRVTGGDGGWTQWDHANPQRLFTEFQGTGNLYRSTNGGASFNLFSAGIDASDRNCFLPPYLIDPTDPTRMLYATQRVYRSVNGGSWTPISPSLSPTGAVRALAISPADSLTVYAVTNDHRLHVSTDGGASFTTRVTDAIGWPRVTREIRPDPIDPAVVYLAGAAFGSPKVRRSTDRGLTWATLDGDLPDLPVNVLAIDSRCAPNTLYAGTDAGVFQSTDDGRSWRRMDGGLPNACVIDLHTEPAFGRLVAATQGRGLWAAPLPDCPPCTADFNGDGFVDFLDLDAFVVCFEGEGCPPGRTPDLNGDGFVDFFDADTFIEAFEAGC
ncbi:MAG: hypothetical protein HRU70_05080 [Phycisphaeraceae bacterium]|nr:MAG: hypothetical protein HRU70_05080 [Phycisphaeraceae bacterium]